MLLRSTRLGAGGSFTEFYGLDFDDGVRPDGARRPRARGDRRRSAGCPCAQALPRQVRRRALGRVQGQARPVMILGASQTADGRLKLIAAEGESIAGPDVPDRQHELADPLRAWAGRVHGRVVCNGPDPPRCARARPAGGTAREGGRPARPGAGRSRVTVRFLGPDTHAFVASVERHRDEFERSSRPSPADRHPWRSDVYLRQRHPPSTWPANEPADVYMSAGAGRGST